jgi:hypothetical protein
MKISTKQVMQHQTVLMKYDGFRCPVASNCDEFKKKLLLTPMTGGKEGEKYLV